MNSAAIVTFTKWQSEVLNLLENGSYNSRVFTPITQYINDIIQNQRLSSPLEEQTENFVNNFCSSMVSSILSTRVTSNYVEQGYSVILKSLAILFSNLITSEYEKFIETGKEMVSNQQAHFYTSTNIYDLSSSYFSRHYFTCVKCVATPLFLNKITTCFKQEGEISITRAHAIFSVLVVSAKFFDQKNLQEFLNVGLTKLSAICDKFGEKEIRSVDDKILEEIFTFMKQIAISHKLKTDIENADINLNINMVKSAYLQKQFNGLHNLMQILKNPVGELAMISETIKQSGIIDKVLHDPHHELIGDFTAILKEMIKTKRVSIEQVQKLWQITIRQHPSTSDYFIVPWNTLILALPSNYHTAIVDTLLEMNEYPDSIIQFISSKKLKPTFSQEKAMFKGLSELYFSNTKSDDTQRLIVKALCAILPNDFSFKIEVQSACIKFIENQEHFGYALPLLRATLTDLTPAKARSSFDSIVSVVNQNSVDVTQYLELVSLLLNNFVGPLNDSEFSQLLTLTGSHFDTRSSQLCSFYKLLVNHRLLTRDMMTKFIHFICEKEAFYEDTFALLQLLFQKLNQNIINIDERNIVNSISSISRCVGIDDFWKFLFKTGSEEMATHLIYLYSTSKDPESSSQFIEYCINNLKFTGALIALKLFIHQLEDGINKDLLGIDIAKYISDQEYITILVTGEINTEMRVPKTLSINGIAMQIAYLSNKSREYLSFTENDKPLEKLHNNMLIKVVNLYGVPAQPPAPIEIEKLPSVILSRPELYNQLFDVVKGNDQQKASIALEILLQMQPISKELQILNELDNWGEILSLRHPFLLIYRLNLMGNLLKTSDWAKHFFGTNGINIFFDLIVNSPFTYHRNILLLLRLGKMIVCKEEWHQYKDTILPQFTKEYIDKLISMMIPYCREKRTKTTNEIVCHFLRLLRQFSSSHYDWIINNKNISELIRLTVFHPKTVIQELIYIIISSFPIEEQEKVVIPLLDTAQKGRCSTLFEIFESIAVQTTKPNELWDKMVDQLFNHFRLPEDSSDLEELTFNQPSPQFANGIFVVLVSLAKRIQDLPKVSQLFWFLIDDVLLNGLKYFDPTKQQFDLILILIDMNHEYIEPLVKRIENIQELRKFNPFKIELSSSPKYRGIHNMGSTCYINANIQQLYAIPEMKEMILSTRFPIDEWTYQLQYVFGMLMFYPSTFIDASPFVNQWRGWDGQLINPRIQQDAVEFLQMLFSRLEEKAPAAAKLFKGEFVHQIVGINEDYKSESIESFVTFPLEVKDHSNVNESLNTFLTPDRFDGQNQLSTDQFGKIDAERYSRVRTAPPILVVQLKRFEYNLSTNIYEKVNQYYTYPFVLDISSVMETNTGPVMYELCGIIIHVGSAKGGHYISQVLNEKGDWYTFNDEEVTKCDMESLLESTTGGSHIMDIWDNTLKKTIPTKVEKTKSAYLLFYRKKSFVFQQEQVVLTPTEEIMSEEIIVPHEHKKRRQSSIYVQSKEFKIDHTMLSRLVIDIKSLLFTNIILNSEFSRLVMKLCDYGVDSSFLILHFMNCLRGSFDHLMIKDALNRCIARNETDESFSAKLLSQFNEIDEFLLIQSNQGLRQQFLNVVNAAIVVAKPEIREKYFEYVIEKMLNEDAVIMSYWQNFDEFFRPFLVVDLKVCNTETWPSVFFNFLVTSVYEYVVTNKNPSIYDSINLSGIFKLLFLLLENDSTRLSFAQQVFESDFLSTFIRSPINTAAFSIFIRVFIQADSKNVQIFTNHLTKAQDDFTASHLAGYYLVCLRSVKSCLDMLEKYILTKENNTTFMEIFFDEINQRAQTFKGTIANAFLNRSNFWVKNFLLHKDNVMRIGMIELVEAIVPKFTKETGLFFYNILLGEMGNVISIVKSLQSDLQYGTIPTKSFRHYLPTEHYFEMMQRTIIEGGISDNVINDSKVFVDSIKNFGRILISPNTPRDQLFLLLSNTIGTRTEEFFKNASLSTFLSSFAEFNNASANYEVVLQLINFIPCSQINIFFKSNCFGQLCRVVFGEVECANTFKNMILARTHPGNVNILLRNLWDEVIFRTNVHHVNTSYFQITWKIMKRFPVSANYFYSRLHEYALSIFHEEFRKKRFSDLVSPFAKVLAVFNESYLFENADKSSFFTGKYVESMAKTYIHLPLLAMYRSAKSELEYSSELFLFLRSLCLISDEYAAFYHKQIESEEDGFLWTIPKKHATSFFIYLYGRNPKILLREFLKMTEKNVLNPEIVHPVADHLLISKVKIEDYSPIAMQIIKHSEPCLFKDGFAHLLLEIVKKYPENIPIIVKKVSKLLIYEGKVATPATLQISRPKVIYLLEFLISLTSETKCDLPNLSSSKLLLGNLKPCVEGIKLFNGLLATELLAKIT